MHLDVEHWFVTDFICTPLLDGSGLELRFRDDGGKDVRVCVRTMDLPDISDRMRKVLEDLRSLGTIDIDKICPRGK